MRRSFKWTTGLFVLAFAAALALWAGPALAATYQWDSGGVSPPSDNSGNWDTATTNWYSGGATTWPAATGNIAQFGAAAGDSGGGSPTVTLTTPVQPATINFFKAADGTPFTIAGTSGTNYLGFSSASSAINLSVASGASATISADFGTSSGASTSGNSIVVNGAGTLTLGGNEYLINNSVTTTVGGDDYTVDGGGQLNITGYLQAASTGQSAKGNGTNTVAQLGCQ